MCEWWASLTPSFLALWLWNLFWLCVCVRVCPPAECFLSFCWMVKLAVIRTDCWQSWSHFFPSSLSLFSPLHLSILQSEYIAPCDCRREFICGFNGSAGACRCCSKFIEFGDLQDSLLQNCNMKIPSLTGSQWRFINYTNFTVEHILEQLCLLQDIDYLHK